MTIDMSSYCRHAEIAGRWGNPEGSMKIGGVYGIAVTGVVLKYVMAAEN